MENEQREPEEPAHHARRPMNAFLIFCKRHRGSVRLHFPHLENRAVTRVLGEWWATLHPDQKQSYINLAQEYKDAFLNANPDFKWYKLPAPPLRTLTTRPTNKKPDVGSSYEENSTSTSNSNYESSTYTNNDNNNAIQPGKLADESQIGGLSSLFTPQKNQPHHKKGADVDRIPDDDEDDDFVDDDDDDELPNIENKNITNGTEEIVVPKPPKKRYTELPINLEQKKDCKADLFGGSRTENAESNNNSSSNNNNNKHPLDLDEEGKKRDTNSYIEVNSPEDGNFRSERSCKGLRYQKFLAEQVRNIGSTTQQNKRRRTGLNKVTGVEKHTKERRNSISSNVSEKTDSLSSEGGNSSRSDLEHLVDSAEGKVEASKPENTGTDEAEYELWTRKRFKAEDFNLEKKIEALPSLSLEEFQEKKKQQRTKKKKLPQKLNTTSITKRTSVNQNKIGQLDSQANNRKETNEIINLHDETTNAHLVGSQKRKARKQSITRNTSATSSKNSTEEKNQPWCASPDLEALACLAELAANRTKLTK
ncbi:Similar to BBX: HMG box transcription factor BBX (Homo sapiens) [Cotesia congregata]|uniref:Similar to BBX: HMG box transcription factor BBX (Homo sapiens) n=1 Tax=Cotesia congregata TaxID=51543 RepID=A0A8J2HDZ7_COTCN|nr:Similar to BBX: HMG box transcription factor BBX (Homo sapiens) [Cotesia congregata]